jgi:hypothetical protein
VVKPGSELTEVVIVGVPTAVTVPETATFLVALVLAWVMFPLGVPSATPVRRT